MIIGFKGCEFLHCHLCTKGSLETPLTRYRAFYKYIGTHKSVELEDDCKKPKSFKVQEPQKLCSVPITVIFKLLVKQVAC